MKKNIHILLGLVQTSLSIYWLNQIINLYINYQNPNLSYLFVYPNWVLFSNILLSIINLYFGIKLTIGKISKKRSYLIMVILIIIGGIINTISVA
ncbi:hypothetical protein KO506_06820 [Polaribacter vadi]|jgi:hypothetical protein|uniref:hypothetical protein n=1 Tax=Polaribacter TaxID=52959 RepID=UPI001C08DFF0|nr:MULTISPECIES: hypothetical protein [Polaribacter]MBU3011108.1 hypothetical protein [Polaribacter vadi]MDO6740922.1 hypothetical protein [Polaribacter sp. 1_MG-2023]